MTSYVSEFQVRVQLEELNRLPLSLDLGSFHSELIYWGVIGGRYWRNYLHTHSFFEVCHVYRGQGTFTVEGQTEPVRRGDLFVARPGQSHEIISDRRWPLGIWFWAFTLVPSIGTKRAVPDPTPLRNALLHSFAQSHRSLSHRCKRINMTLELLLEEARSHEPGLFLAVQGLTTKLLLDTARLLSDGSLGAVRVEPKTRTTGEAVAQSIQQYLRDNLQRPLNERELTAQFHMSPRHLRRLFRAVTGKSMHAFLTGLRVEAASQLLLDWKMPIKQVAAAVGYPDVRYFTTLFGNHTGMTPVRFRESKGTRFMGVDEE